MLRSNLYTKRLWQLTLASTLLLATAVQAVDNIEITQGSMLALSCAGCHGSDGQSPGAIPTIAGKSAGYIANALQDFRSGNTASTVMERNAKGYTDEEIKLIAEYFANN